MTVIAQETNPARTRPVIDWAAWAQVRKQLAASASAFSATARNSRLLRAQLAFTATWTAETALTVAIAVVAFRDGGAAAVGLVAFVRLAPSAVVASFGTAFADRFQRDRLLIWTSLIRAAAIAAAACVLAASGPHVAVYTLAVIATAAYRLFRPAHMALLPGLCSTPLELRSANTVGGLLDSVATLLGPIAAALLLGISGPAAVLVACAVLALAAAVPLIGLAYEAPPRGRPQPLRRIAHETVEGFQALVRYREAGLLVGLGLVQSLTQGFFNVFVVVIALDLLGMGPAGVGVLAAVAGAGSVLGSLGTSMVATGRQLAILEAVGVVLWGLPLTLTGVLQHEPVVLGLMLLIGFANALGNVGLHALPARLVPEELLGRVFGVKACLTGLSIAVGAFVTPFAINLLGIRGALVVLGLVAPVLAVVVWQRVYAIHAGIAHRDQEIEVLTGVEMFRPLPLPAIDNLAVHVADVQVAAGQAVFRQGDNGDRFYVIEDGEVDVIGDNRLIRTMRAGDGFGEMALLHDEPRVATACARTPLRLRALDRRHFLSAVNGYASSKREANALVLNRLADVAPCSEPTAIAACNC